MGLGDAPTLSPIATDPARSLHATAHLEDEMDGMPCAGRGSSGSRVAGRGRQSDQAGSVAVERSSGRQSRI